MYIYESHMGGFFTSDEVLDYEDTYCEECGDSDTFIGWADTQEEALRLLEDKICRDYTGQEACDRCGCLDKIFLHIVRKRCVSAEERES